jgi:putative nucleotidyltransferase with HDIG domain
MPNMLTLEQKMDLACVETEVKADDQSSINAYLTLLKIKDDATYEHSLRVGLLASRIGSYLHLDAKALLFAGLLHDVGKSLVNPETLKKTVGFGQADKKEMDDHVMFGYRMLRGKFDFTAEIILRHHLFQERGYPADIPEPLHDTSLGTEVMKNYYGRILALADFYDALTSRNNDAFGGKPDHVKAKEIYLEKNSDQKKLIEELYANGILGEASHESQAATVGENRNTTKRNPREVRRYIELALSLEPVSEKHGCTTRSRDKNPHSRFEYFLAGAINIGEAFEDLASRVIAAQGHQPLVYDLAYRAQLDCKRNREGGRVNQGMIEMLTPIVTAQLLYDVDRKLTTDDILGKASAVLTQSTRRDVDELVRLKRLANEQSQHDRVVPDNAEATSVLGYYQTELTNSTSVTSIKHNEEFVNGFPTIKKIYESLRSTTGRISERMREAYLAVQGNEHKGVSGGLTADCCGAALYLYLSQHSDVQIS